MPVCSECMCTVSLPPLHLTMVALFKTMIGGSLNKNQSESTHPENEVEVR